MPAVRVLDPADDRPDREDGERQVDGKLQHE
jgi:hypothetical protein